MVANEDWMRRFPKARVFHSAMSISDHCLLKLSLNKGRNRVKPKKRFMFEAMWTRDDRCRKVVEIAWDSVGENPECELVDRLRCCKENLQKWNWQEFGNVQHTIKQKRVKLQQLESLNGLHDKAEEVQKLKTNINKALTREEIMWSQRSRAMWIKWGDRNMKFFHATASQRQKRNSILGLMDSDQPSNFEASLSAIHPSVTPAMNASLTAEFRVDEIWNALHQMHPTKSPGPDGMSPIFYHKYWDVVGPKVIECVLKTLNSGVMPSGLNETFICLIPKVKSPQKITEYCPISLCNVSYKIISKVLANRLKRILAEVVNESQSAFMLGRLISDNVMVAFETMHCINGRRKGKDPLMALKLDMNKAYDRVEWRYLAVIMRRLGFNERWISLMMMCISTVTNSVLINGEARGSIVPSRRLRQGDPISPFLFLLCSEGLSAMLRKEEEQGNIWGIAVCRSAP
ncbi:hypothetical protein SO802_004950 [Lithocarpus litseifolius]|uniref:Reverse transcriptase domain-containing protein n=1 Tax=Lithocarpus litseifolius TaxID=425828 RepID=A0AAW2DJ60_9ROSI